MNENHALVVLSGGQDSATCLALAMAKHSKVSTVSFSYGQRHAVELSCAGNLGEICHVDSHKTIDLFQCFEHFTSALLQHDIDVTEEHPTQEGCPITNVPRRNAIFLTVAHGYATEIGADHIYTGVCQTDYSGYPDCRDHFIKSLEVALNIGYEKHIRIHTPLMFLTKAETFALAAEHNFLGHIIDFTHTCYEGDHVTKHDWGFGCGVCPACDLRKTGWEEYSNNFELTCFE